MKREYLIIATDFWADLGNQFIILTLLDLLIFNGTNSLLNLVWLRMIEQAPTIILSPFAGFLVDRIGAQRCLAEALVCKCILCVILVFSIFPGVVISVYFFFICASLFFTLGRLAIIPLLVTENRILSFNALSESVAIAGGISSPFLVAGTIEKIGRNAAIGVAGLLFLMGICTVFMLPKRNVPAKSAAGGHEPVRGHLFSILKELFKENYNLKTYFILTGFVLLGGGILNFSLPLLFKDRFGGNISQWGFLMSLYQAGAFLSTLLLRCLTALTLRHTIIVTYVTLSAAMAILGHLSTPFQLSWLMVLFGCGFTFMYVLFESLIQKNSPAPHVGKIVSAFLVLRGFCYLAGIIGSACVIKLSDIGSLLLVGALILLTASILVKTRVFGRHSNFHPENLP